MTTIILTTIGIILAASVAVMTVWYGGQFLADGAIRAKASAVSNAGANVAAAYGTFELRNGRSPASLTTLLDSALGDSILSQMPEVAGQGDVESNWAMLRQNSGLSRAFAVRNIPSAVCAEINKRINGSADVPMSPTDREGCYRGSNDVTVYYAFLGPARSGDPSQEYVASPQHAG